MTVVVLDTHELQAQGLQHQKAIDDNTLFVFPFVRPGDSFHSRNVPEPFDLAFLSRDFKVLGQRTLHPTLETMTAPPGSFMAVESKAGRLIRWGFVPGLRVKF